MLAFVLITSAASAAVPPQNGTTMCCQWRQRHTPAAAGGCGIGLLKDGWLCPAPAPVVDYDGGRRRSTVASNIADFFPPISLV